MFYIADAHKFELFQLGNEPQWIKAFPDFNRTHPMQIQNRMMSAFRDTATSLTANKAECYSERVSNWIIGRNSLMLISDMSHQEIFHNMWCAENNVNSYNSDCGVYEITGTLDGDSSFNMETEELNEA